MKAIRHTGIVVSNLGKSLKFYRDLLGLRTTIDFQEEGEYIDKITGLANVRLRMVKLVTEDGSMIELLQYLSHPEPIPENIRLCKIGVSHIAFTVNNVDEVYNQWSAKGIKFNCPPQLSTDGKAKVAFCQDPDGTFLEMVEVIPVSDKHP